MSLGMQILCYTVGGLIAVWILIGLFKSGKPIRSLAVSAIQGFCALAAVNITGAFTGVSIGLNLFSTIGAVALGVPGVITLLILKTLFGG